MVSPVRFIVFIFACATTLADPIHDAVQKNDVEQVRTLLKQSPSLARARDAADATPLHYVAISGNAEIAKLLLDGWAELNAVNKAGDSALIFSLTSDTNAVTRLLIEASANLALTGSAELTPLQLAAWNSFTNAYRLLMKQGAIPDIFSAVARGDVGLVTDLIQTSNSVLKAVGPAGATPLHWAAARGNTETLGLLLNHGANLKARATGGRTVLHHAVEFGTVEAAVTLLEAYPQLLEMSDDVKLTPLQLAALTGKTSLIELFLSKGARLHQRDIGGSTALCYAALAGQFGAVQLLVAKGAAVNDKNIPGITPLHYAVGSGSKETVQFLLSKKADASQKNKQGQTPLDLASAEVGKLLIPHMPPDADISVFYWALRNDATDIVTKILLRKPVLLRHQDKQLAPPLHFVTQLGKPNMAELLLAKGADVNSPDTAGQTPLHVAVAGGHKALVELFLAKGANVNARGIKGATPLRVAIDTKQTEIIPLLRKKGARD
jgi:ankyrin repeat protein